MTATIDPARLGLRIVRTPELMQLTGFSRPTLRKLELASLLPACFRAGERGGKYWRRDQIEAWLAGRQATAAVC
ncbi:helix-turn-helix transcriptional regulator [Limnoglobus roseus]|uniref:DNA-binding protein n=1 Tax=Limnoglobus roseus TaxID=2598579 RepID=A0A5C1AQQ8_9BACT|nr:AlpA family phage regulatory protein [Limnoglobus roseus]QEL20527.1 hypothetical protein PX52LOC_07632 [Limnoglobus roseus]